jgi:(4S)-4-hydroxy-5-phosphonooxypentane-2,3-dione isomerase
MRYAIIVEFTLHEGALQRFMPLMLANAAASLDSEPGCARFDVLQKSGKPNEIVLYEIYRDRAAFDAHLTSAHFREFNVATAPLIRDKRIVELAYLNDGGK